jgi:3-phenylpropionate/trans-cinnamate dioxygenase ferredoxin subunit
VPAEIKRVKLALLSSGTLTRIEHPPFHIVLARVGDAVHAIEDACPHSGRSLCSGTLEGVVVTCPGHAWQIDIRTGCVVKPQGVQESNPRYPVTIEGDDVVVWAPLQTPAC